MIRADGKTILVTGPGPEVMAELGQIIAELVNSLARQGASKEACRAFMHSLVDIAIDAPAGTTIDLSFRKED